MPTEDAYSSGHLVLSHFGTCKCSNVETNLSWNYLVSGLLSFEHPSILLFYFIVWHRHTIYATSSSKKRKLVWQKCKIYNKWWTVIWYKQQSNRVVKTPCRNYIFAHVGYIYIYITRLQLQYSEVRYNYDLFVRLPTTTLKMDSQEQPRMERDNRWR